MTIAPSPRRKHRHHWFIIVAALIATSALIRCAPERPSTETSASSEQQTLHLYLLIGQSNMVGRAELTDQDTWTHPRIITINRRNEWEPACNPLPHTDTSSAGVGPGMTFARTMAEQNEPITIGLIPCAKGGSALSQWLKGEPLYFTAVKRTIEAKERGVLKGILWHQGESDAGQEQLAKSYARRLAKMFDDLRSDLGDPNVPIVVGEIGRYLHRQTHPYTEAVNEALGQIPQRVPHSILTTSQDLTPKDDGTHLDTKSQREMGKRYARKMLELQGQQ